MKFYLYLLILTLFLAGLLAAAQTLLGWYGQGNLIWFALGFYVLLSVVSFQYTLSAKHLENNRFVGRFLMTTGMRIILCAIFLAIYLIISVEREQSFVLTFMCLYLFYTIFEIYHLVIKLRPEKKSEVESTSH